MQDLLNYLFRNEPIEYFAALPIECCNIINKSLYDRCASFAKSVIIFLIPYYNGDKENRNISLYAVPRDYHKYIDEVTDRIILEMARMFPDHSYRGMGDHSPIAETSAAAMAGLGVIGDNHRLINEKYGSYVFIGEIFTSMKCDNTPKDIKYCNHCGACQAACPSPDNCLSALTQQKGELTEKTVLLMQKHNTAWGCDICQTVCPMNKNVEPTPIPFFKKDLIYELTPHILTEMSDEGLKKRAFGWRKRKTIERNIKILSEK